MDTTPQSISVAAGIFIRKHFHMILLLIMFLLIPIFFLYLICICIEIVLELIRDEAQQDMDKKYHNLEHIKVHLFSSFQVNLWVGLAPGYMYGVCSKGLGFKV
uniref:Uncharacterized protein n=1 Tax=Lactuca sativa TaxID=4236 RepID=A0A9R1XDE5_LACSA|nr:hypothetical protein LSAT_V11C400226460 [Lactuca sativa]